MKHRLIGNTCIGLGGGEKDIFDNQWTNNEKFNNKVKEFFDDVLAELPDFKEIGGFDFRVKFEENGFYIMFGIEPAYKYDKFICYYLDSNGNCHTKRGRANGYYGSDIKLSTCRINENCTKKYRKLIDKHLEVLIESMENN